MKPEKTIPIIVVAGFLGAGKTSLINHLLQDDSFQCKAVLVNDFGAAKLDTHLITPDGTVQLVHGCICCSSRRVMQTAVEQMVTAKPAPEKILIEASSVADPCAIVSALEIPELKTRVTVKKIITVVAADQVIVLKGEMAQLVKTQLIAANLVLVNKIDLVSERQLNHVLGWVQAVKTGAPVLTAYRGSIPIAFLQDSRVPKSIFSEENTHGSKP